jgi:PIN domain nuclease of toxin-antitoxin system
MKLLLDTQIFIWLASDPDRLSADARAVCQDMDNTLILSVASVWEMQIKQQLGRLQFVSSLERVLGE